MACRTFISCGMIKFLVFAALVHCCTTEEEIGSPLRVAQCRARCLQRFSNGGSTESCKQGADCYMCWDNCQLLQSNFAVWGTMCNEKGICFPGCKEACQFQKEAGGVQQKAPVIQTRGEEVISVTEDGVASWPEPSRASGPLVYVVMRRAQGGSWWQVAQTVERSAKISPPSATIRVLAVNRDGLVTIYSPRSIGGGLATARAVLATLGKNPLARLGYPVPDLPPPPSPQGKRINTEILPTTHRPLSILEDGDMESGGKRGSWNLHEVSLIHQKVLVIAEISWEGRSSGERAVYFVTWEVDGGGLKGNLFTDSTCVTLSLWPDTIYHIQVELVRHNSVSERSEELVLDTHRAVAVEVVTERSRAAGPARIPAASVSWGLPTEHALGFLSALVLFLLLLAFALLYSSRLRSQHHLAEKLLPPEEHNFYRGEVRREEGVSTPHRTLRTLHV